MDVSKKNINKIGRQCVAYGCYNRERTGIPFHRFPGNEDRKKRWLTALRRVNFDISEHSRLCGAHFVTGRKSDDPDHPDYVPSIFSFTTSPQKRKSVKSLHLHERIINRQRNKINKQRNKQCSKDENVNVTDATTDFSFDEQAASSATDGSTCKFLYLNRLKTPPTSDASTCTRDLVQSDPLYVKMQEENKALREQVNGLSLDEQSFVDNDTKVNTYTGLPNWKVLSALHVLTKDHLSSGGLTPFNKLLMTLMKIKFDLPLNYLAQINNVSQSTCSRVFNHCIHVLYIRLVPLSVFWPESSNVRFTLPACFLDTFPKCVSIIDCFEIFIEQPSAMEARAKTYSSYKSHHTVKYLISVTPQGTVNFISLGWGGRASDRAIVERSRIFLDNLNPGDVVLADRGFNIDDILGLHGVKLEIPAFTKGKSQLSEKDLNSTRNIASVRIHVERVIGQLRKKYSILGGVIPIQFLQPDEAGIATIDKIVHVACGLTNICASVVPKF